MDRLAKVIVLTLWIGIAHAEPVGLQFKNVKTPDLIEAVVKGILHMDFVIAPEVASSAAQSSLSVRSVERDQVLPLLRQTLASDGITVEDRGGVLYFGKGSKQSLDPISPPSDASPLVNLPGAVARPAAVDEVVSYHPKHRTAEVLAMALKAAGATIGEFKDRDVKLDFMVFTASADRMPQIWRLLAEIDIPIPSVLVKAALIEVSKSSDTQQSLYAALNLLNGKLGLSITPAKTFNNAITLAGASIEAVLSAVEGDSNFRSLSEPQLKVVDGETARLVIGQEVPVRGNTVIANNQTTQGVEYRTAGVVIEIQPRITRDNLLMKVKQTVSDFAPTTTSGIDSPTMQKREASTTVTAKDGELVMIAGMDSQKDTASDSGLSFLPAFMRSTSSASSNTQMLLLLQVSRLPVL